MEGCPAHQGGKENPMITLIAGLDVAALGLGLLVIFIGGLLFSIAAATRPTSQ